MPGLFALDQNFPQPIVDALAPFMPEAELVSIRDIDERISELDDWEVLLAIHLHERPWDGLITTDSGMLRLPRELATLMQTKLTLVVAEAAGNDPLKATGLVLAHLQWIAQHTDPTRAQVWTLRTTSQPAQDPWERLQRVALHQHLEASAVYETSKLSAEELSRNPLG